MNAFLSVDFLTLLVVTVVVGFILGGAWEVLLEIVFQRSQYDNTSREAPVTRFVLVEGGLRYGLTMGFFIAVATTFGRRGLSADPLLWLEFLLSLGIYLTVFFLGGCVFGFFMWGTLKTFGSRVDGTGD
jgi:hypothetical protein